MPDAMVRAARTEAQVARKCLAQDCDDGGYQLTTQNMNGLIRNMKYAVRGKLVLRAQEIQQEISQNPNHNFSFDEVIFCNIGNPQAMGQKPLTFPSQVLSVLHFPSWESNADFQRLFPDDVLSRAQKLTAAMGVGGLGKYSHSQGHAFVRESVASFIEARDGFAADPSHIFLTAGASPGIKAMIDMLSSSHMDAFLVPNPQYPLYSASIAATGTVGLPYDLTEHTGWSMEAENLEKALLVGRQQGLNVRALVVINPGNPTGQCLTQENMEKVIEFCARENLVLMADEVYQSNVYIEERPFISFKKVLRRMEASGKLNTYGPVELVSFHSTSKGLHGECGRRGGYMELTNFHPKIVEQIYKAASVSLCPNTVGQMMVELMVNPPREGDTSYPLYKKETEEIYESLRRRALMIHNTLNEMTGISVQVPMGAMYAYPRLTLPNKAITEARRRGISGDMMYAMDLLEKAGLCIVPGSGFELKGPSNRTKSGTEYRLNSSDVYFRTTFLPPEEQFNEVLQRFRDFHEDFMERYS